MKKPVMRDTPAPEVARRLYWLEHLIDTEFEGKPKVFEERTGVKMAQVNQWFTGYRSLRENAVDRLIKATGKPPGWFDRPVPTAVVSTETPADRPTGEVVINEFDTGGAMGYGFTLQDQPGVIRRWVVSPDWLQQNVHRITSPKNLAIVTGFGDSMRPLYNPGDPLLIDRGISRADIDGIYFFRVGNEGFVKRLQRIPTLKGVIIRAKSENPKYDPFDIVEGMDFEVFGRVVKAWRGEEF